MGARQGSLGCSFAVLQPLHQKESQHMNFLQGHKPCKKADSSGNASGIPVFVGGVHYAGFPFD
ncbi:hypothetical protein EAI28_17930 [Faecalicatena contorta]|nr:hypothetical protein [Faecalicatena contorta]